MIDKNKVKECVEKWLEDKDYFLVDIDVDKSNKVTVEIDNKDGVWINDCCDLSSFIEEHFDRDVEDFELEVGSAGIGQPFKVFQQYENNIGNQVEVLTEENKKVIGKLTAATTENITINGNQTLSFDEIKNVRAVIEFE